MKKVILFLLTIISVQVFGEVAQSVVFDFNFKEDKTGSMVFSPGSMVFSPAFSEYEWINGIKEQLALTDRIASVDGYPIELEFKRGGGYGGVVINYTKFTDHPNQNYHSLQTRTSSLVTVRNTTGCELDSIRFYGSLGSLAGPSTGNLQRTLWVATTPTDTVQFMNHGSDSYITSMEVFYKYPSKPLNLISSTPSSQSSCYNFSEIVLNFDLSITKFNTSGITLTGPGITTPVALTPTVSDSRVTLTAPQTYMTYGDYTVNIPAGTFKNSEGGSHDDISITFKVDPKRDIINYTVVDPAEGTYTQLPESIVLNFGDFVSVPEGAEVTFSLNGTSQFKAPVVLTDGNTKSVTVSHGRGSVADQGTWTVAFPEKTIYNGLMGDEAGERWNPAFTLTYKVESAESQVLKAAKALKAQADLGLLGYPTLSSDGYKSLETAVAKGEQATEDELNEAMVLYYSETNVKMPENGKWYRIANVNADDTHVYLTYNNKKITLNTTTTCKDAYQLVAGNNVMEFKTKDNHYLTVPGSGFEGFIYDKSGKASQLTVAKLQVAGVDPATLLGKFSITGWLGRDANDEDMGNSTAALDYPAYTVTASPTNETYFSSSKSSAFVFEETSEACDGQLVTAEVVFADGKNGIELDNAGDPVTLMVLNVASANIAQQPYYKKQTIDSEETVNFPGDILAKKEITSNYFTVNTAGLAAGQYILYIPAETFNYVPRSDDETVNGQLTKLSITIKNGGGEDDPTETPVIQFVNGTDEMTVENAGSEVVIQVLNVDNPVVYNQYSPYYVLSNSTSHISANLNKVSGTTNQFSVSASGLSKGVYSLVIPSGTFKDGQGNLINEPGNMTLTIKNGVTLDYSFTYTVDPKVLLNPSAGRQVVAEVELNDLIVYTSESSIVPNPDAVLRIVNLAGGLVKEGHLEDYPNFLKEVKYDYLKGMKALKVVLDPPFVTDELKYSSGIYFLEIPAAAFGDANFGKWLKNPSFTGTCVVNKESKTYFCWNVNDIVTGIEEISADEVKEQKIYDLSGRQVKTPKHHGVYIVNGKKIMVK